MFPEASIIEAAPQFSIGTFSIVKSLSTPKIYKAARCSTAFKMCK
jgi:hypothetical protein